MSLMRVRIVSSSFGMEDEMEIYFPSEVAVREAQALSIAMESAVVYVADEAGEFAKVVRGQVFLLSRV